MISSFNLEKLNSLLKDFYNITHIRITVFDEMFHELTSYPVSLPRFCQTIRSNEQSLAKCLACDQKACSIASKRHSLYTYRCHAGLTESIVPLYMDKILIGYLIFGHIFSYDDYEEGWKYISQACADYPIDLEQLKPSIHELTHTSEEFILSASHIMQAVASFLCMERIAYLNQTALPVQIDSYISEHFTEDIDVPHICKKFNIGKTFLYEISQQNYGIGIAEHIRNLRIEKSKKLLTSDPQLSISEIAFECGFHDYSYFITVFRKHTGIPPKQYRTQQLPK